MKIITYNVNGIRAAMRKDLLGWMRAADPDILCIQEIKAREDQIDIPAFENLGYHVFIHSANKPGYSGVAVISRERPKDVVPGIGLEEYDIEGRLVRIDFENYSVISVYMPSGASKPERQEYKIRWLQDFRNYLEDISEESSPLIIAGDFNICHKSIDIHDPYGLEGVPGYTEIERNWLSSLLHSGFTDTFRKFNPKPHQYSWWSYMTGARIKNLGWRIDYILTSKELDSNLIRCRHLSQAMHSDHCPVSLEIDI